jgi:catechol 2,3-dioxygenase-like lactoylglutathione lyase family enzyme
MAGHRVLSKAALVAHDLDPSNLPASLRPYVAALQLDLVMATPSGYRARDLVHARFVDAPGVFPHDGGHATIQFLDPGICLRLALTHPAVPGWLAERLRVGCAALLGGDDALYVYSRDPRSQMRNRGLAIRQLADLVETALAQSRS